MLDNISRYSQEDIELLLVNELGEKYRKYRECWKSIDYNTAIPFPLHIDFELNDKCNQSCTMCPRNAKTHRHGNYRLNTGTILDLEKYKEVIDEGSSKGLMSINLGAFAEPLINKNVFAMVRYAHSRGIVDSRVITNGLLLDKYTDEIFDSGLVNLFCSVDAYSEEQYRRIRGNGFQKVISNILSCIEEKKRRKVQLPIIRVSFVEMNTNSHERALFLEYWKDKVDYIDIQVFDDFDVDVDKPCDRSVRKKWSCKSPWARVSVLSDGEILPCCNFFGKNIPIGHIKEGTIEEAWNSSEMKRVREGILNDKLNNCAVCQRVGK